MTPLPVLAVSVSWDGGGDGTSWDDPLNWTGDALPAAADDVTIDVAGTPVIEVSAALEVRSLTCEEDIVFSDSLTLTGGSSVIKATSLVDRSVYVSGGAVVEFPLLTTVAHPGGGDMTLQASGGGSRLVFANVTSIEGREALRVDVFVKALDGGRVEFPMATQAITGAVDFEADGAGSVIDVSALTDFDGYFWVTSSGFHATNGGVVETTSLLRAHDANISSDTPGNLDLDQLAEYTGSGAMDLTGGGHDLSGLTDLRARLNIPAGSVPLLTSLVVVDSASIFVSGGAVVQLPLVTVVKNTEGSDDTLQASGAGSRLVFPNVTSIEGREALRSDFFIKALDGGRVEFPAATQAITGAVDFAADGANSVIDVSALTDFVGYFWVTSSGFHATNGGVVEITSLLRAHDANISSDTPGNLDLDQLAEYTGSGAMDLTGGVHDLSGLAELRAQLNIPGGSVPLLTSLAVVDSGSIFVSGGAVVQLPLVTVVKNTVNEDNTLQASGVGSLLEFPNVTLIEGREALRNDLFIKALDGGRVEFPVATQAITGAVDFTAEGANSVIDVSALTDFDGFFWSTSSGFHAINGGVIDTASLVGIHDANISCDTPGNLDLDQVTSITGIGTIDLTGGVHDLSVLATLNGGTLNVTAGAVPLLPALASIDRTTIAVSGGAALALPLVTSYTLTTTDRSLIADGAGSRLELANLTTLNASSSSNRELFVRALAGGVIDLSGVIVINNPIDQSDQIQFIADGTGSVVDLTDLTTVGTNTAQILETNGGDVHTPGLDGGTLPDLEALDLAASTGTFTPGSTVTLTWNVRNDGGVEFDGSRRDSIFFASDAAGTDAIRISNFPITSVIAPGATETIMRTVTVPTTGLNGAVFVLVRVDEASVVIEADEEDNEVATAATVTVPPTLTLWINRGSIHEVEGGNASGQLSRNGDVSLPLTVALSASPSGQVSIPATATFGAGNTSKSFPIVPVDDGVPDGDQLVTITAQEAGFASGQDSLEVLDGSVPTLQVAVSNSAPIEGDTVTVTVSRNNVTDPLTVNLALSAAWQASVSGPADFAAGESSKDVTLTITDDDTAETEGLLRVVASAPGFLGANADLTVLDNDEPALTISLNRSLLPESASAGELLATVTRATPTSEALVVGINVSDPAAFEPLGTTFIPANQPSVTIPLAPVDNDVVDGTRMVTLWAQAFEARGGGLIVESAVSPLDITDDDGPTLTVSLDREVLIEGAVSSVTITRNVVDASTLIVSLGHDGDSRVSLPTGATIPANEAAVTVLLDTTDNASADGPSVVGVTASATAFEPGFAALTLTDESKPELLVSHQSVSPEVNTNEVGAYTYRIENQGSVPTTGPLVVHVFLSRDQAVDDDDTIINEYLFEASIPAGLYFERSESFVAPLSGGTFYILVRVDSRNEVEEILETNNVGVSPAFEVVTAYGATVATDVNVAPAGTEVPLTGAATMIDGGPAAFELVNIHIMVQETKRIISALTDSNGQFSTVFRPLPGEGGSYVIGATHPGDPEPEAQDSFTLLGFETEPNALNRKLVSDGSATTGSFTLRNVADATQTGLSFALINAPAGVSASFTPVGGDSLGALAETEVDYSLTASAGAASGVYDVALQITGAEGGLRQIGVTLTICQNTSELQVDERPVNRGMIPGEQTFVNFTVRNVGGAPTGPLHLFLPANSWISAAVASPLPSLDPDEEVDISLQLCPPADLALLNYTGAIALQANDSSLTVPYEFRALSEAMGDLVVHCEDELTYYASGQPPLAGATATLTNALSGVEVATSVSGADGNASFADLNEGYYELTVTAEKHATYRQTIFVNPGEENSHRAFLALQTVEYIWSVQPTEIEDRYKIVVEAVFETNVPAPVVTIEPSYIDLNAFTEEVTQVDVTYTNHGLIAASNLRSVWTSSARWQITALSTDLGDLPAKSSLTMPVVIKDLFWNNARSAGRAGGCPRNSTTFDYECGDVLRPGGGSVRMAGDCGGGGSVNPGGGGPPSGPGGPVAIPVSGAKTSCDPCLAKALVECYVGYIPGSGFVMCPYGIANASNAVDAAQAGLTCACTVAELTVVAGIVCNTVNCFIDVLQCVADSGEGGSGGARGSVLASPAFTLFDQRGRDMMTFVEQQMVTFGDEAWRGLLAMPELGGMAQVLLDSQTPESEDGRQVSVSERAAVMATDMAVLHPTLVSNLIDRLNRTFAYYEMGIYEVEDLSGGMNDDFVTRSSGEAAGAAVIEAVNRSRADGYADPFEAYVAQQDELFQFLTAGDGVCARVRLRIEQEAVMTRDAFEASLEMINNDADALESVNISIQVVDENDVDQSALFGIDGSGLTDGTIAGETSGMWNWTIIPTSLAAPTEPVVYYVKGDVSYMYDGLLVEIPLAKQSITVLPTPSLKLKYFHQRDVFSDDPHTDVVEPSIPYSLGVMVQNEGAGTAKNLRITSSQPEIVDNEKGLFIDFDIIATEVSGQGLSPSLTADFGDLDPGGIKIGRWLLKSSLQGLFTEYEATFQHLNSLGDERLSLIEEVTIHETRQVVAAPGAFDDGLPDFLTNDVPDFGDTPDTVHLSDGTVAPVTPVVVGSAPAPTPGQLEVVLTLAAPSGWMYARLPDPGDGAYRLTQVERSDGRVLPIDVNAWMTDRTFIGLGLQPVRENKLHLFDHDSTGSYTLTYTPLPVPDTQAPTSMVEMLPASASGFFSVEWSGSDDTAIVAYDIYVSEDGGPFALWLENSSETGGLYLGTFGSDYAFFSVAHDAAGNAEAPKTAGEAMTTVDLVNQDPTLNAISDLSIQEGLTVRLNLSANDPDGPNSALRYSVSSSEPGIVIGASNGRLRWFTTESDGGQTVAVTVTVTDGNVPAGSLSQAFNIVVTDDNKAPVLEPFDPVVLEIDEEFSLQVEGDDPDLPVQTLSYHLVSGAPSGMTLDAATGELLWTPDDSHGDRSFEIVVEVSDNQSPALTARQDLLIEVLEDPGLPPVFDPVPAQVWVSDGNYELPLRAVDPEGEPVTLSADFTGLPGFMGLSPTNADGVARLSWFTADVAPGLYEIPLTASTDRQSSQILVTIEVVARAAFSDYYGWADAYGLTGVERIPFGWTNRAGIENLLAYALGIDPLGGVSPILDDPRPSVVFDGALAGLGIQLPDGGRSDIRYRAEGSADAVSWDVLATKEGQAAWNVESNVTEEVRSPSFSRISVWSAGGPATAGFFRLIVEFIGAPAPPELPDAGADVRSVPGSSAAEEHDGLMQMTREGTTLGAVMTIRTDLGGLLHTIETSEDLRKWKIVAFKDGSGPWQGDEVLTNEEGGLQTVRYELNHPPAKRRVFLRHRVMNGAHP